MSEGPRDAEDAFGGPSDAEGSACGSHECPGVPDPHLTPRSPQRCLQRIHQALQHYRDLLGSDIFQDQPQPQLETTMEQLLRHVQEGHGRPPRHPLAPTAVWARHLARHLALKRLRSFAAVISRVFNHSAR
ncbi:interleukin-23 subunit alpha [Parus major]|uniref:interleukin-23 subunit alpha n=1 Tax=Parus major TaxID=9157 RepID=UPI001443F7F2|nr:interleukin-23 subunit alpha [Parus major]